METIRDLQYAIVASGHNAGTSAHPQGEGGRQSQAMTCSAASGQASGIRMLEGAAAGPTVVSLQACMRGDGRQDAPQR